MTLQCRCFGCGAWYCSVNGCMVASRLAADAAAAVVAAVSNSNERPQKCLQPIRQVAYIHWRIQQGVCTHCHAVQLPLTMTESLMAETPMPVLSLSLWCRDFAGGSGTSAGGCAVLKLSSFHQDPLPPLSVTLLLVIVPVVRLLPPKSVAGVWTALTATAAVVQLLA